VNVWEGNPIPRRNANQTKAFDEWDPLPLDLDNIAEFGEGPYSKLRLILKDGCVRQSVQLVTLLDPMASEYIANPSIETTCQRGQVCINASTG